MKRIFLILLAGLYVPLLYGNFVPSSFVNSEINVRAGHPFVLLEHININTGTVWNDAFQKFYFDALGFVYDPRCEIALRRTRGAGGITNGLLWANIGLQQIHFPFDEEQRVRGYIGLEYKNLDAVASQLQSTNVSYAVCHTENSSERFIETQCPVGNRFRLHQQTAQTTQQDGWASAQYNTEGGVAGDSDTEGNLDTPSWLGPLPHITPSAKFEMPGGRSLGLGISYVNFDCPTDTARKICRFYEYFFGSNAHVVQDSSVHTPSCMIPIGFRQHLRFTELPPFLHSTAAGDDDVRMMSAMASHPTTLPAYDGHHIAVYVNDFVGIYARVAMSNLHWDNPRFPQFTYSNVSEVLRHNEFRIKDIIDIDTNEIIYQLEHEIR